VAHCSAKEITISLLSAFLPVRLSPGLATKLWNGCFWKVFGRVGLLTMYGLFNFGIDPSPYPNPYPKTNLAIMQEQEGSCSQFKKLKKLSD